MIKIIIIPLFNICKTEIKTIKYIYKFNNQQFNYGNK